MAEPTHDEQLESQIQRLHALNVRGRWLVIGGCWLAILPPALWHLRAEVALLRSHFTLTALRYAIEFNLAWSLALGGCVGLTLGTLLWQSGNILRGWAPAYRRGLEKRVARIRATGPRHPLWRWVVASDRD